MKCKNCRHDIIQNGNAGYLHYEKEEHLILNVEKECHCGCTKPELEKEAKKNELGK